MSGFDIYFALTSISWRKSVNRAGYSAEYLDAVAVKTLRAAVSSMDTSPEAKEIAQATLDSLLPSSPAGSTDKACMQFCQLVLQGGNEEDFTDLLAKKPRMIQPWRKIWDSVRRPKKRTRK